MKWHGIVHFGPDFLLLQEFSQTIPFRNPNDELIVDMVIGGGSTCVDRFGKNHSLLKQPALLEQQTVTISILPTSFRPAVQVVQFHVENSGLYGVQTEVPADHLVIVFWFPAMDPEHSDLLGKLSAICDHHPAIAQGT